MNPTVAIFGQNTNAGTGTHGDGSSFGWGQNRETKRNDQYYKQKEQRENQEEAGKENL